MRAIDHLRNHALAQCGMFEGFFGLLREIQKTEGFAMSEKTEKHTPLPWERFGTHIYHASAVDDSGANVCTVGEPRPEGNTLVGYTPLAFGSKHRDEAYANAAFICRAVNAHDELLAALKDIVDDYSDRHDLSSPSTNPGIKLACEKARAAIAKAELDGWKCRKCGDEFETNMEARGHERREPGHTCDPKSEE